MKRTDLYDAPQVPPLNCFLARPPKPEPAPPFERLRDRFTVVNEFSGSQGWTASVRERDTDSPLRILKVLNANESRSEISLLASLDHPQIARVLETGPAGDQRMYLLREHIEGEVLATMQIEAGQVRDLATQLFEVLTYVHARGILHLDIKPENIICSAAGYHLLDFGLGSRRGTHTRGGTPFYSAPERWLGLLADERADLFSVGVLLFVVLNPSLRLNLSRFRRLFPAQSFFDAIGQDAQDLPAPFDEMIPRLVTRNREHRYPDALEALEVLSGRTGRPSLQLLRPDPIALFGEEVLAQLSSGTDLKPILRGSDGDTLLALAFHLSSQPQIVTEFHYDQDSGSVVFGSARTANPMVVDVSAITERQLAHHLEESLHLSEELALPLAEALLRRGANTPSTVEHELRRLVETGVIVPDGARWSWPEASSGRIADNSIAVERSPEGLFLCASRGLTEGALRAYRDGSGDYDDRELRHGLTRGLLAAGEPARALPFCGDLPELRARTLFDLGRVDEAEQMLLDCAVNNQRLRACIQLVRGELQSAHDTAQELVATDSEHENRIVFGQVLLALARPMEAAGQFHCVLEGSVRPFALAAAATGLGEAHRAQDELGKARKWYEFARRKLASIGHVRHCATAETNLGVIAKDLKEFAVAFEHHRRARSLYEYVGDERGVGFTEANLGMVSLEMDDAAGALRRLTTALERFDRLGVAQHRDLLLIRIAKANLALGDARAAESCLAAAHPASIQLQAEADQIRVRIVQQSRGVDGPPAGEGNEPTMKSDPGIPKEVFRTFIAINRKLASESDLGRAMQYLLDAAVTLTGGRSGYLLVTREGDWRLEFQCGDGSEDRLAFSRSMVNRAIQQQRTQTAADVLADPTLEEMSSVRNLERRSAICCPFRTAAGNEGAIYIEHPTRAGVFGREEHEHLEVITDQAAIAVDRMLHEEAMARELQESRHELAVVKRRRKPQTKMIGTSPVMKELLSHIKKIAPSELSILVTGETGSGKELAVRAIHDHSNRSKGPFIGENCSAIPESLVESELFGHVKGSFTGADNDKTGLLELASGGTLFLDEIGDMPMPVQTKLLRAIQERSIRRVGGSEQIAVDVRIISATHRDLRASIEAGEFREDLYFRLAAAEVRIPPLRDRGTDLELLTRSILEELGRENNRRVTISDACLRRLKAYAWPGNVRELHHLLARAFILADGQTIEEVDLPEPRPTESPAVVARWPVITLAEAERRTIEANLEASQGDKTQAARALGISRTSLYERLKRIHSRETGKD